MGEGSNRLRASSSKGLNVHFLCMESLGLLNPFIDSGGDDGHGEDHGGDSLINPQGELVDEGDVIGDSSLVDKILEVSDVLLEPIVSGSIGVASGFLNELGEIQAGSSFGVKWVKCGFEVLSKLVKGLLVVGERGIGHPVIPHFSEGGSSSFTHLIKGCHDLVVVRGIESAVEDEVGLHDLNSSGGIGGFSGKV